MTTPTQLSVPQLSATARFLRGLPMFSALLEDSLERLAERCVTRSFPAGSVLFTTGEVCRGLYMVVEGRVRVFRTSPEGREQVLHVEVPGCAVAELPLLDGGSYPMSAVTLESSRLLFLPRPDFEHLYRTNAEVAGAVMEALGNRLRHMVQLVETLAFRDVAARLAMLLADYADRMGERMERGVILALQRTQDELSLEIGSARESVSRAWGQLKRQGLIEPLGAHRVLIPSVERLRAVALGA